MDYPPDDNDHPQAPLPPKPPMIPGRLILFLTLAGLAVICGVISTHSSTPTQTSTSTPATSIADQMTQAFSVYRTQPTITPTSPDSFLVEFRTNGNPGSESETIATSTSLASEYEQTAWQANITGLRSVTVVIVQEDYPNGDSTTSSQDIVKCIVITATGTSLDWNSGTPLDHFQHFDVKWVIGQGTEP